MAHDDVIRRNARKLYVNQRQSLPTIAIALTVSEPTLRRWKRDAKERGDDWDVSRAASTLAGEGMEMLVGAALEDFMVLYQSTIDALKGDPDVAPAERVKLMASLADALNKMVSSSGRIAPKTSQLGVAMDVLKRQAEFVRENYSGDVVNAFVEMLEPFSVHLSEAYGS
ncbi:DUF1804 family protein [Camelimonas lactis]|uniref:Uncharacterized protein DUF1804 n=1 Tax=Camelimonas lactis TaxID=659006 RepID=A0A4R2GXI7_9HYPH|nr:DUF1804 family protein [Camelimonas lactis]TCO15195.1 uncharacterized protein DUF1804 [Camelimonas lactis]